MERNKFRFRTGVVLAVLLLTLGTFVCLLYYYQIRVGVDATTTTAINTYTTRESVSAARGIITSSDGTVLIDNQTQYRVTLDFSEVSDYETQVYTVRRLLQICQEQGVEWTDELPISQTAPYIFTNTEGEVYSYEDSESGQTVQTRLGRMCEAMGWHELTSATALMDEMKETFGVHGVDDATARDILGVLYTCYLRINEIIWTSYDFADDVDIDFIAIVKEEGLPGISIDPVTQREIRTSLAAHLLGQVGYISAENWEEGENYKAQGYDMDAIVGLSGVEYAFESYLQGIKGERIITLDNQGDVIGVEDTTLATAGYNVELTLDMGMQAATEEALDQYIPGLNNGEGGGAAVMVDVNSGAVLSCASWPTYDPTTMEYNDLWAGLSPLFNRALQGAYSPGSTYKMVTATAGLESGIITPYTEIEDTGVIDYYGTEFRCWLYRESYGTETHGMENVTDALRDSCNIFFYQVGIQAGIDTLTEYAQAYGLGVPSGIELTENVGINAGPEYSESVGTTWYGGNTLSAAIGQSDNLFTPLQIANYVATLVNGGTRYAAHLLQSVTAADGTVTEYEPQVLNTVNLSASSLEAIKQGMLAVVENTSTVSQAFARLEANGIRVGAKTGSAQVTGQENANGLFVCFAPYDDPEVAICVAVEKGGSGAATAVIAAHILEEYFGLNEDAEDSGEDDAGEPQEDDTDPDEDDTRASDDGDAGDDRRDDDRNTPDNGTGDAQLPADEDGEPEDTGDEPQGGDDPAPEDGGDSQQPEDGLDDNQGDGGEEE